MGYTEALVVINLLAACSAVVTNATVFIAIVKTRRLHNPSNVLLCSLTISDFAVGLIVQPLFALYALGYRSQAVMYMLASLSTFFSGVSLVAMVNIAIDRFMAVYFHLRYRTLVTVNKTLIFLLISWLLVLSFVLFLTFGPLTLMVKTITVLLCNVLLMSTAISCYVLIHKILRRHKRQIQAQLQAFSIPVIKQGRAIVTMFYIHGIFIVSGMPLFGVMLYLLSKEKSSIVIHSTHIFWASTIVFLNSCVNPYVYCWRMRDLRRAVFVLLGWSKRTTVQVINTKQTQNET